MRAFVLADPQSSASFRDLPVPEPGPGEVLVRVGASSVNGWDTYVASGMARGSMELRYPVVLGKDFAGTVDALGEGVDALQVGDDVVGIMAPGPVLERGSFAEFLVAPAEGFIERRPTNLSVEEGGALGLAALTALVAVDSIDPHEGDRVLIAGAAGGVGAYAVQLAAARGATVIATALPEDEAWISDLGAVEVVEYTGDVAAALRERHPEGIDALIDAVNRGDAHGAVADLVRDGGRIATTTGSADVDALAARGVGAANVFGQADPGPFARVVSLAAEGSLRVPITRTFAFEELPEALGLVGARRSRGKLAVRIG